jgi:Carboxypeptidase regulatory-like domain/TonB-dependent Receptor Plug Domain
MRNRFFKLSFLTFALILLISTFSVAQDLDNVTISGKVADSNKQPITGATISATLVTTGAERTVQSDEEGRYRLVNLPPGVYSVKITATGFGAKERKDLTTVSGQNVQLNFELVPGDVSGSVVVTGEDETTTVDTTRTVVGGTITEREIETLPTNTRNALDLVLTTGGTAEPPFATADLASDRNSANNPGPTEQGNFSLSGGASYSNNLTIDGLDNNDDRAATSRFQPSIESISEVQIIKNQFSAEYGRASGGRINLRTKSGTNKFRGRLFSFFRTDNWNANTYYNNFTGFTYADVAGVPTLRVTHPAIGRPDFYELNPGFTFSGPVILPFGEGKSIYDGHNKTFFSVAYEYNNLKDTTQINTYVPSGGRQNPRFTLPSATSSDTFCETQSTTGTPAVSNCSLAVPRATLMSPYVSNIQTPNLNHSFTSRIDHKLTNTNDMTFGLQLGRRFNKRQNVASTTRLEEALQGSTADTDAYNFTDNHIFGARAVNQFRMQWSKYLPGFETVNPDKPVVLIAYTNPSTLGASTLIAGNSTASNTASGLFADKRKETRYQFQDSLTYIAGNHTFKGGFDFQRVNSLNLDQSDATGTYNFANGTYLNPAAGGTVTYSSIQNYLLNQVTRFRQNFDTSSKVKNTYWALFLNDEFKLSSNLQLSYGVRYEKEKVLADNNNWGPRIGVAWDPFKSGKGVIRFGGGIFYNRVLLRSIDDFLINGQQVLFDSNNVGPATGAGNRVAALTAISAKFPNNFASAQDIRNLLVANGYSANAGFTGSNTAFQRLVDVNSLKLPESYQLNIGFEREISKLFVVEANYTWNKTARLWREYNPNAPRLPAGFKDFNDYLITKCGETAVTNLVTCPANIRYENATNINIPTRVGTGGVTVVNLNSDSSSAASSSPIGFALATIDGLRPNANIDQQEQLASIGNAKYQALVLELRSRYRKLGWGFGGNVRFAYTLSTTKDDGIVNTSDAEVNGDFSREFTRSLQDRRHRIAVTGSFNVPKWLGGLKFSPLFRFGSSAPFALSNGGNDRNLDDLSNDRLNYSGDVKDIKWRKPGTAFDAAFASQFSLARIGEKSGNLPRNAGTGPSFYVFDLGITREWKISERIKFRPNVEIGNVLNAVVYSYGSSFIDFEGAGDSSTGNTSAKLNFQKDFLIPTRAYRPREIRLGFRLDF